MGKTLTRIKSHHEKYPLFNGIDCKIFRNHPTPVFILNTKGEIVWSNRELDSHNLDQLLLIDNTDEGTGMFFPLSLNQSVIREKFNLQVSLPYLMERMLINLKMFNLYYQKKLFDQLLLRSQDRGLFGYESDNYHVCIYHGDEIALTSSPKTC